MGVVQALLRDVLEMMEAYRQQGLADGFFVTENLFGEAAAHDLYCAIFHTGLMAGAWLGDNPLADWKLAAQLFREHRGGVATVNGHAGNIPVYSRGNPPIYYTFPNQVALIGLHGVPALQAEECKGRRCPQRWTLGTRSFGSRWPMPFWSNMTSQRCVCRHSSIYRR